MVAGPGGLSRRAVHQRSVVVWYFVDPVWGDAMIESKVEDFKMLLCLQINVMCLICMCQRH